jgi:hypothetical protein
MWVDLTKGDKIWYMPSEKGIPKEYTVNYVYDGFVSGKDENGYTAMYGQLEHCFPTQTSCLLYWMDKSFRHKYHLENKVNSLLGNIRELDNHRERLKILYKELKDN